MRVRGDLQPSNAFTLEEQPNKPGRVLARFFENAKPFEETEEGLTISGWEYDEYHLELDGYDGLEDDILNNFAGYLAQAKLQEAEQNTIPDLKRQVAGLESDRDELTAQLTALDETAIDLFETQQAQDEINAAQDDALCELYEMIGG